jgi:hypothetical protein
VLKSLEVFPEDQEKVKQSIAAFLAVQDACHARLRELAEIVTKEKLRTSRGVFAREVASQYATPEGPALLKLWDEDERGAAAALTSYAVNRLCEQLDLQTAICFSSSA